MGENSPAVPPASAGRGEDSAVQEMECACHEKGFHHRTGREDL